MKKHSATSPLFTRITTYCQKHSLIKPTDIVVVGFSGGPDSLFLLHVLTAMLPPEQIVAAHLDHGWRPESKSDAEWCKQKAESLGVLFVSRHLQDYASLLKNRGSKEDSARQARRLFFKQVAEKYNAHKIALAHHADDLIETFFIRLIRGAGIQGLSTMRPHQGLYIRPLLELSKDEIIKFLETQTMSYLIDPSNKSPDYLRNRIRHTLMPALTSCDSRVDKNIQTAISHIQEVDTYLDEQALKAFESCKNASFTPLSLTLQDVQELHPLIRHRVLVLWLCNAEVPFTPTKAFFTEIERFLFQSRTSLSHQITPGWTIQKNKSRLHETTAYLTSINNELV